MNSGILLSVIFLWYLDMSIMVDYFVSFMSSGIYSETTEVNISATSDCYWSFNIVLFMIMIEFINDVNIDHSNLEYTSMYM